MRKTILVTGSTDGIGLETARSLVADGHHVILHGRNEDKLQRTVAALEALPGEGRVESALADLSNMAEVRRLADQVAATHPRIDVLINNAGVLRAEPARTADGFDVRFAVNTLAPYLLTRRLLPLLSPGGRVVNLSSAAQASVNIDALRGRSTITDAMNAYAQSKLALTMWTLHAAHGRGEHGVLFIAVNPGSLLATKMVKEGFGMDGNDVRIGADVLVRAALSEEFSDADGRYFDNDHGRFASPHPDALDAARRLAVVAAIESALDVAA